MYMGQKMIERKTQGCLNQKNVFPKSESQSECISKINVTIQ